MSGKQYGLLAVLMAVGSLLGGCVRGNPFGRFYYDMSGGVDLTQYPSVEIAGETLLVRGTDPQKDPEKMLEDGYVYLGYSYFNAGNVNEKGAIRQGRKLGAAVVLLYSQYTNTVSGAMPMTVPDTRTSQTYGSGNIYGYGGSGFYSGSATTTSYGTRTTYVPYSVRRYDYLATYWVKTKGAIFGAYWRDLTPEERESMGSNKGVMIIAVRKGSCAFDNDFFKGDMLKRINDNELYDAKTSYEQLPSLAEQEVEIEFIRDGETMVKRVRFGKDWNKQAEQSDEADTGTSGR